MKVAVVCTTVPSLEVASRVADALVESRLAACVQRIGPIRSTYRWNGALTRDEEYQLVIKTTPACIPSLVAHLVSLHPYEVPEVLVLDATAAHLPYALWLESCAPPPADAT